MSAGVAESGAQRAESPIWTRAAKLADDLRDEGFNPVDSLSVQTIALAMSLVFTKRDDRALAQVEETAVRSLRKVVRIMHEAREAQLPAR